MVLEIVSHATEPTAGPAQDLYGATVTGTYEGPYADSRGKEKGPLEV